MSSVPGTPEERLREVLELLDEARARLQLASGDPDQALATLAEVNELVQQAAAEVERARDAARAAEDPDG
jgi:hypothetical protein